LEKEYSKKHGVKGKNSRVLSGHSIKKGGSFHKISNALKKKKGGRKT